MTRYYIFQMTNDGPSRLMGKEFFSSFKSAQIEAEKRCKENPTIRLTVMQKEAEFWQDPNPKVLNDMPVCESPEETGAEG